MKLSNRLLILIFPLVLFFSFSILTASSIFLHKELKENLSRQLDLVATLIQERTTSALEGVAVDMEILESDAALVDLLNYKKYALLEEQKLKSAEVRSLFKKIVTLRPPYLRISLLDLKDQHRVVDVFTDVTTEAHYRRRSILSSSIVYQKFSHELNNEMEISAPFYDPVLKMHLLRVRRMLTIKSVPVGSVQIDVCLNYFLDEVNRIQFIKGSNVIVNDSSGHRIRGESNQMQWLESKTVTLPGIDWQLKLSSGLDDIQTLQNALRKRAMPFLVLISVFGLIVVFFVSKLISKPAEEIVALLNGNFDVGKPDKYRFQNRLGNASSEFKSIGKSLDQIFARIETYHQDAMQMNSYESQVNLAQQVAHDIRSPLAALNMVTQHLQGLPEEERVLIRSASHRINDIVNGLVSQYRRPDIEGPGESIALISGLLDSIITEKRMQYRAKIGIQIETMNCPKGYGLFAKVNQSDFKRVISNLINNSVEAVDQSKNIPGIIKVELEESGDRVVVRITDNGAGMPEGIIEKLGQRGITRNKADGLGLGIYHAKQTIESWGGTLRIVSDPAVGTQMSLLLPRAKEPSWFLSELKLRPGSQVVIVDDDLSVHQIWEKRFHAQNLAENSGVRLTHFSAPEDLILDYGRGELNDDVTFLVDYEFIGHAQSGLELIQQLGIQSRSFLVTSHFEEKDLLAACEKAGVQLIPKGLAANLPITIR
jgi:signal transduction histidine kinase